VTSASASFPAAAASVPTARRFVRSTLASIGLSAAWDAAELLVSEVVTNAVLHARTEFTVEVHREADVVRVSVHDRSPVIPKQRIHGIDSTTGRGMRLVATLAVAWGVDRHDGGKAVWFEVRAAGDPGGLVEPWATDADVDGLLAAFGDLDGGPSPASSVRTGGSPRGCSLGLAA
jgi:anti-sigma regulatory factor (Ser/Thr protein kinase)